MQAHNLLCIWEFLNLLPTMLCSVALYLCENVARSGFCGGFVKLNYKSYGLAGKLLIKMVEYFFFPGK